MDWQDEVHAEFAAYRATGRLPQMPDQPGPAMSTGGRNWLVGLTLDQARSLDRACADGVRGNATVTFTSRRVAAADDAYARMMNRFPETEAAAAEWRAVLDARAAAADPGSRDLTWARESARRAEADRERQQAAAAEADRKEYETRVKIEVERRLQAMGKGKA